MVNLKDLTKDIVLRYLEGVRDPEIPVLSVIDLGIIRDVIIDSDGVRVKVTPTYSGCPALKVIEDSVAEALRDKGITPVIVERVFSPAWSTDWITSEGRRKLKEYGIAPPGPSDDSPLVLLAHKQSQLTACPFCNSAATEKRSDFGATACKALYYCNACQQPFEAFKPH
jgi:ring-1,2-phenylacetyl-CoA epoxidase subunit PaaD